MKDEIMTDKIPDDVFIDAKRAYNSGIGGRHSIAADDEGLRAAGEVFIEWERNRIADYLEGKDGKIPGVSCYARLISRNNQPCMSGDPRDRLNRFDRREFDEATSSLAEDIRNIGKTE